MFLSLVIFPIIILIRNVLILLLLTKSNWLQTFIENNAYQFF